MVSDRRLDIRQTTIISDGESQARLRHFHRLMQEPPARFGPHSKPSPLFTVVATAQSVVNRLLEHWHAHRLLTKKHFSVQKEWLANPLCSYRAYR